MRSVGNTNMAAVNTCLRFADKFPYSFWYDLEWKQICPLTADLFDNVNQAYRI